MAYTTDELLKLIKQKAFIPTSQITFQDTDILDMASSCLKDTIVPMVLSTREEFYVTSVDVTVTGSNAKIDIPSRAIGMAVREISCIQGDNEFNMVRYSIEDLPGVINTGSLYGFYLMGNQIHLLGTAPGTIRIYYLCRPGDLVKSNKASKVTGITGTTVTVTGLQSGWSVGSRLDFVKANPGFDTLATDATVLSTSGSTQITFDAVPDRLQVGDWVCTESTSPVAQVPVEFYSYLAQLTAVDVLDALGDTEAKNSASAKLEAMKDGALKMITPRVQGEAKKLVPPYNRGYNPTGWGRY